MTSVLNVDTIANKAGTGPVALTKQSAAKQYAKFTVAAALSDSFNTSSITDSGSGDFEVNFSSAMGSAQYAIATCTTAAADRTTTAESTSASAYGIATRYNLSRSEDSISSCGTNVHGDLA